MDPAIKNFGWAVLDLWPGEWKIAAGGLIGDLPEAFGLPVNDSSGKKAPGVRVDMAARGFGRKIDGMLGEYRPEALVLERFQNRGRIGQSMTERVNLLIGIAAAAGLRGSLPVHAVSPSEWKRGCKRDMAKETKACKAVLKGRIPDKERFRALRDACPHVLDASAMCLHVLRDRTAPSAGSLAVAVADALIGEPAW